MDKILIYIKGRKRVGVSTPNCEVIFKLNNRANFLK